MKKLLTFLLLLIPCIIHAQNDKSYTIVEETENDSVKIITTTVVEKEIFFTNGFWHNWELIVGVGPHVYLGENDLKVKSYLEMIAVPTIDISLTKWASPSIGISFNFNISRFKGLYQSSGNDENWYSANFKTDEDYTDADPIWDYMKLKKQRGWYTELFALAHLDLLNVIDGYNPTRFFSIDFYIGGGVMIGMDSGGNITSGAFNTGFINKFRLTDHMKLTLAVKGALIADDFDGELYIQEPTMGHRTANIKMDGDIGLTVGLSVLLGKQKSKWHPARRTTEIVHLGDMAGKTDTIVIEKVREKVPELWFHINFEVDRWEISSKEKVNLNAIADVMKSIPGARFLVCGYADMQTASPSHNLMLSEKRSKAVFDYLVDVCGVDPAVLVLDYKGGVDYMFYDEKELSRCVMITTIQE